MARSVNSTGRQRAGGSGDYARSTRARSLRAAKSAAKRELQADVLALQQQILHVVSYVDTVKVWVKERPTKRQKTLISLLCNGRRRNQYQPRKNRGRPEYVTCIILQRPSVKALLFIHRYFDQPLIAGVHIALDLVTKKKDEAAQLWEYLRRRLTLKRRWPSHSLSIEVSTMYFGPPGVRTNLVMYPDLSSKVVRKQPCLHLEVRTQGSDACRQLRVHLPDRGEISLVRVADLLSKEYWRKHIRLTRVLLSPRELKERIGSADYLRSRSRKTGRAFLARTPFSDIGQIQIDLARDRGHDLKEVVHVSLEPWIDKLRAVP